MTSDNEFEPRTARPLWHPVVQALMSEDPGAAFLVRVRERLDPGEWAVDENNSFWWVPGQLKHRVEILRGEPGSGDVACRSDIVLVRDITDLGMALTLANYYNQRSFGCGIWLDVDQRELHASCSVTLGVADWFCAVIFLESVVSGVAICEQLAPRLISLCGGELPDVAHPSLGRRDEPDVLAGEWPYVTFSPECTTGAWLSPTEHHRLRRTVQTLLTSRGLEEPADLWDGYNSSLPSVEQPPVPFGLPLDGGWLQISVGMAEHPELGRGFEALAVTSVQIGGDTDPNVPPQSTADAMVAANLLNIDEYESVPDGLVIGGWTSWRNQLCRSTYVLPELTRTLTSLAHPGAGDMFAIVGAMRIPHYSAITRLLHESDFAIRHADSLVWTGVADNAGLHGTLCDLDNAFDAATQGVPINAPLSGELDVTQSLWFHQHSVVYATFGIFNPVGPSVGSIELMINYSLARAALVERTRHPFSPSLRLHAHLDQSGLANLPELLERIIAELSWSPPDWFEFRDLRDSSVDAMTRGLMQFAERSDFDPVQTALRIRMHPHDPWARITDETIPIGLPPTAVTPGEFWVETITAPDVVDAHVAFLRSAWQGAVAYAKAGDPEEAQRRSDSLRMEIEQRRLETEF